MDKRTQYVAFFDLDRTITGINSGHAIINTARKKGKFGTARLLNALFQALLYRFRLRDPARIIATTGKWLKGTTREALVSLGNEAFKYYLEGSVFPSAIKEIEHHRSRGARIVLLSSAIREICEPAAAFLGIGTVLCTDMQYSDGVLTGEPDGRFCYGEEKKNRIELFCKQNNFPLGTTFCYADAASDIPALEISGNPVCVNPDRKLTRIAAERGWEVIRWEIRQ